MSIIIIIDINNVIHITVNIIYTYAVNYYPQYKYISDERAKAMSRKKTVIHITVF